MSHFQSFLLQKVVILRNERKLSKYGEIVSFLEMPESILDFQRSLKRSSFSIVGKKIVRKDIPEKSMDSKILYRYPLTRNVYEVIEEEISTFQTKLAYESEVFGFAQEFLKIIPSWYGIGLWRVTWG